jgi:hypothetical protein
MAANNDDDDGLPDASGAYLVSSSSAGTAAAATSLAMNGADATTETEALNRLDSNYDNGGSQSLSMSNNGGHGQHAEFCGIASPDVGEIYRSQEQVIKASFGHQTVSRLTDCYPVQLSYKLTSSVAC